MSAAKAESTDTGEGERGEGSSRKLLIVTSIGGDHYGATSSEIVLARHLVSRGHTVRFIVSSEGRFAHTLRGLGCEVIARSYSGDARKVWKRAALALGTGAVARRFEDSECVLAFRLSSTPLARSIGRRLDVPVLSYLHGYAVKPDKYVRHDVHRADMVIAVSRHAGDVYATYTAGVRSDQQSVEVILNGIDDDAFRASACLVDARETFGIPRDVELVGMVGAHERKGTDVFVQAAIEIGARRPDTHFLVAGAFLSESFRARIEGAVEEAGLTDRFHFIGFQENIAAIMQTCDAWAMPSRNDAFPLVGLETQAVGTPMVASSVGGVPEMMLDGETSFLVPKEDPGALAERLSTLLQDGELRKRMGERGQRFIHEELPLHKHLEEFERCLERLISRGTCLQPARA